MHEVRRMDDGCVRARVALAASMMGLVVLAGCHAKGRGAAPSELMAQTQTDVAEMSAKKVGGAAAAITAACAKEPYENARIGLIVAETGLHEDVFDLRDRVSYKAVPFGLGVAQRLEALLQKAGTGVPAEQAACIAAFAAHFKTLTDPLVEADTVQRQLDLSAFNNASKEADQETEQEEKALRQPASGRE
jgi:hypothetical protein